MPFTVNPAAYQGGQFLFSGMQGLGTGIGEAIKTIGDNQKLGAYNDFIVNTAFANGEISHDELAKYQQGSLNQKTGIAAGIAANFAHRLQLEQINAQAEQRQAMAQYRAAEAARQSALEAQSKSAAAWAFKPIWSNETKPRQLGVYGPDGTPHFFPGVDVKAMGGGAANTNAQYDPVTRTYYYIDANGNRHDVSAEAAVAGQIIGPPGGQPGAAPAATPPVFNLNPQGGAAPTATPPATGMSGPGGGIPPAAMQRILGPGAAGVVQDPNTGALIDTSSGQVVQSGGSNIPAATEQQPVNAGGFKAGQGGYVPGRRYAGKLYMGGDPNDASNWM